MIVGGSDSGGGNHTLGLTTGNDVFGWGTAGFASGNTSSNFNTPVQMAGTHKFIALAASNRISYGLKSNGELWGWGDNSLGYIGIASSGTSTPDIVVGGHLFGAVAVNSNQQTMALKSNGEIWRWGSFLGTSPTVIATNSFIYISAGRAHWIAIDTNGYAWGWGANDSYQIGPNTPLTPAPIDSPVIISTSHSFVSVFAADTFSGGLKSDGSVWTWGSCSNGALGLGASADSRSTPTAVLGSHSFTDVHSALTAKHVLALKANGEMWGWGRGFDGQLNNNSIVASRTSPILISFATLFGP